MSLDYIPPPPVKVNFRFDDWIKTLYNWITPQNTAGQNNRALATTSFVNQAVPNASYRDILQAAGSHTAAAVAGTYGLPNGEVSAITGVGIIYPLSTIYIDSADFPTVNGITTKLRVRAQLYTNDVAPTGNYTIGLHPITRPAVSGAAGVCIYTIGAAIATAAVIAAPAADGAFSVVSADFALPANGHYILGFVTSAAPAAAAHVHINAQLQMRNA